MYPFFRLAKTIFNAKKKSQIAYTDPSSIEFRCHPWDLDLFNEMNNGRVATLYDLGRIDLSIRGKLMPALLKNKWALVVAGSSVRYRKRIHMFDKITMHSRFIGFDDRWMYLEQSMWVRGEPCSSILIRGGVTGKQGLIAPAEIKAALGAEESEFTLPDWVHQWIDSEQHRPWPPQRPE
ncbi:acyl-CoA thioesterase [uncultured Ferrimonas sp.]|uniref:acyl-CoA thioesterase n=1 Tax=uncultured Ferrimonas sp. TaxID=432640 RepID=UPI002632132E|nr:acyl-CoA thioesterase [uncultured Ferrimonas sp.]